MRAVLAGGTVRLADLAWGGGLAVAYLVLAGWTFAHVHRHAVRTGLIARYSAETAG
jgi:ABC-2 type transport system permease protein